MGLNDGLVIVLSGPSGSGKTTIRNQLLKSDLSLKASVSYTSRPPRPNEVDGVDYFFLSRKEFEKKVEDGQFAEWACYNNNYYGTSKDTLETHTSKGQDLILTIDTQGALNLKKAYPKAVLIFIMPASLKRLESQLRNRKTEAETDVQRRIEIAKREMMDVNSYDYLLINDKVKETASQIRSIIIAEKCRVQK